MGHFRRQNDARNRAQETTIVENGFWVILVVLGAQFWPLFVNILCLEKIVNEKGEHVFSVDSCTFSKDFQGPQGTENRKFGQKMTSWDMQFFGRRVGSHFCHFWATCLSMLGPKNIQN